MRHWLKRLQDCPYSDFSSKADSEDQRSDCMFCAVGS